MMDRGNLIVLIPKKRHILETFVMGSDAAEFLNKVKDQVRKRQKRMSERCRRRRRTFNNLENVYGCDDECGDIHGKEFPG